MHGHVERLAHQVPQRDVDAADRARTHPIVEQRLPNRAMVKRVAPDDVVFNRSAMDLARPLAPTNRAIVRRDLHDLRAPARGPPARICELFPQWIPQAMGFDIGDFHGGVPWVDALRNEGGLPPPFLFCLGIRDSSSFVVFDELMQDERKRFCIALISAGGCCCNFPDRQNQTARCGIHLHVFFERRALIPVFLCVPATGETDNRAVE